MSSAFKREAVLIGGIAIAVINAFITVLGAGGFDDGIQLADLVPIVGPILAALGIRTQVWSQVSADELAPTEIQERVKARRRHEGQRGSVELGLLLVIIGIALALLVHYALGILVIIIGLVFLIWPRFGARV